MTSWHELGLWWAAIPGVIKGAVGATAGTLFGAWISSRALEKREIISELKALQAAHSLCINTLNKYLGAKRQQIKPLCDAYNQARADFELYIAGPRLVPFPVTFELHTLPEIHPRIDPLEKLVFERCRLSPKGLAAAAELSSAIEALNVTVVGRNKMLDELRLKPVADDVETARFYFGIRDPATRRTDERHKLAVEAIGLQVDDCIFFSRQLVSECLRSSNRLIARNRWKYRLRMNRLKPADSSRAERMGLLPPDENYAAWLQGFKVEQSWWRKLFAKNQLVQKSGRE